MTPASGHVWTPILADWYQHAEEAGTHSAAGWALRQWNRDIPEILPTTHPTNGSQWHVNRIGMTMLRIPSGSFTRRVANASTAGIQTVAELGAGIGQRVILTRPFLLSDREVSIEAFRRFVEDPNYPEDEKPNDWKSEFQFHGASGEHPVQRVSWNDAVLFCNWLSQACGLKRCYKRIQNGNKDQEAPRQIWRLVSTADGYRLPTEAEWEYACRAGVSARFSCGDDEKWVSSYAVYRASQPAVRGSRLPNRWGLFDMHGNMWEWCHDWLGEYGSEAEQMDPVGGLTGSHRVTRGGSWDNSLAGQLRATRRGKDLPSYRSGNLGFRVAANSKN